MSPESLPIAWAKLFFRAASQAGATHVVLSPGSRSTPLAIAAHESPELTTVIAIDERTAAFFALGQARMTGRPTVLVCTSGTAPAHYYPALIEASMSRVPLIALTADRPWELQQAMASQTIDQDKLFGGFVRGFFSLGVPEPRDGSMRAVMRIAAQAVALSMDPSPGPVHVNAPFRKPLERDPGAAREPWHSTYEALSRSSSVVVASGSRSIDPRSIDEIARLFASAERGVIACGPAPAHGDLDAHRRAVLELSAMLRFPILAEATSQMRFGAPLEMTRHEDEGATSPEPPVVVSAFDALLRSPSFRSRCPVDVILQLGDPPISAGIAQLVAESPRCRRVVVTGAPWSDPTSTASFIVHADVAVFCREIRSHLEALGVRSHPRQSDPRSLTTNLIEADAEARAVIDEAIDDAVLTEATVAREVVSACPPGSSLMLGNSSPVRDVDAYVFATDKPLRVLHQRGASGIDGLVSGAIGAWHASREAVTLLLGDLSFLHDLGGLALLHATADQRPDAPLVIVVVNNAGGRIFEQLPIRGSLGAGETFERLFATPQHLDMRAAAEAFGIQFVRTTTSEELTTALRETKTSGGRATLIEAVVSPQDGAARHKAIWSRVDKRFCPRKDEST